MGTPDESDYLSAGDVARLLHVTPKTVARWADRGWIPHTTTLGGHRRFLRHEIEKLQREVGGPCDPARRDDAANEADE